MIQKVRKRKKKNLLLNTLGLISQKKQKMAILTLSSEETKKSIKSSIPFWEKQKIIRFWSEKPESEKQLLWKDLYKELTCKKYLKSWFEREFSF